MKNVLSMPALFSEIALEHVIINKSQIEGYDYVSGDDICREVIDFLPYLVRGRENETVFKESK